MPDPLTLHLAVLVCWPFAVLWACWAGDRAGQQGGHRA